MIDYGIVLLDCVYYCICIECVVVDRYVDYGMVLFFVFSVGVVLMSYCVLWIVFGWEGGGNGVMMVVVIVVFFVV